MNEISATSLDRLKRYGVLEQQTQVSTQHSNSSENLTTEPVKDVFDAQSLEPAKNIKTIGAVALITYLIGVATAKGKLNPLDALKGLYELGEKGINKFFNLFKKS